MLERIRNTKVSRASGPIGTIVDLIKVLCQRGNRMALEHKTTDLEGGTHGNRSGA